MARALSYITGVSTSVRKSHPVHIDFGGNGPSNTAGVFKSVGEGE